MKGLIIIAVLLLGFSGGLYLLLRPSEQDLVRIEEDAAKLLDEAAESLAATTRTLNSLLSIRPNLVNLDQELNQMRSAIEERRKLLATLQEERPERGQDRAPFLRRRKELRRELTELNQRAADLRDRVGLVDEYMRTTQPRVQAMNESFRSLFETRRRLEDAGVEIDRALTSKIDYLYREKETLLALARNVVVTGSKDVKEGRTLATSVAAEVERLIGDAVALTARLGQGDDAKPRESDG